MILYVETSALLCVLYYEPNSPKISAILSSAKQILSSSLAIIEAERSLIRAGVEKRFLEGEISLLRGQLVSWTQRWHWLGITPSVEQRCRLAFPVEPVRSWDAIHISSALELMAPFPDMVVLTLDERISNNLAPLGLLEAKV